MTNWKHEKEQKSKIKIIRTGVEISLTKRTVIKFLEEGEREEKKKPYRRETALPTSTCAASTRKEQDN